MGGGFVTVKHGIFESLFNQPLFSILLRQQIARGGSPPARPFQPMCVVNFTQTQSSQSLVFSPFLEQFFA